MHVKQNLIRATELIGKALEPGRLQQPEFIFTKRKELINHMLVGSGEDCKSVANIIKHFIRLSRINKELWEL